MVDVTIAGLADAQPLSVGDYVPVNQPSALNPATGTQGDTRKTTLAALTAAVTEGAVKTESTVTQEVDSNLAFAKGRELLGTKATGAQANIASLKTYNEGEPDEIEQTEIGSETEHLNLNTNETGEFGDEISVDTRDPVTHAPKKEVLAYKSLVTQTYRVLTSHAGEVDGAGRNLLTVLGVSGIPAVMAEIRRRCNNNGEIDSTGIPDFTGLMIGDYLDGINLSAIPAHGGGTAGQVWNDTYKNNRIVLSGFNTFKGAGDTENSKNHLLFTFRNDPLRHRMNPTNDNTGGYAASELRAWLEGANGDGTGQYAGDGTVPVAAFLNALKAQIGNYIYPIRKYHSIKSNYAVGTYSLWPPSELEVYGTAMYGDEGVYMPALTSPVLAARVGVVTPVQFPIFQKSYSYRIKRYNGTRDWWWELTPYAADSTLFAYVSYHGYASSN
jgi:hypothetical protein